MLTTAPDCAEKSQFTLKLKTAQKLTMPADYNDDGRNLRHSCPTTTLPDQHCTAPIAFLISRRTNKAQNQNEQYEQRNESDLASGIFTHSRRNFQG